MKNFVQPGKVIPYSNSSAIESGLPAQIGTLVGISAGKYEANEEGEYSLMGVYRLAKDSALVLAQGVAVDWDDTAKEVVATTTGDFAIGAVFRAAGNGATLPRARNCLGTRGDSV